MTGRECATTEAGAGPATGDPSVRVERLLGGDQSAGACSVFGIDADPGLVIPPFCLERLDVLIAVRSGGIGVCGSDGTWCEMGAGDACWLPRGSPCRIDVRSAAALVCVVCPAGLEDLATLFDAGVACPPADDLAVLFGMAGVTTLPRVWGAPGTEAL